MARKVMQRVVELINIERPEIRAFLQEVLRIERAHLANAESSARVKIHAELVKQVSNGTIV
jgi:uncharacterized protein (UPF0216 family)